MVKTEWFVSLKTKINFNSFFQIELLKIRRKGAPPDADLRKRGSAVASRNKRKPVNIKTEPGTSKKSGKKVPIRKIKKERKSDDSSSSSSSDDDDSSSSSSSSSSSGSSSDSSSSSGSSR